MIRALSIALAALLFAPVVQAQDLQSLLQQMSSAISDPSRRTVGDTLGILVASGLPEVRLFLERWQGKQVWQRDSDGLFF